ncbi:hypothetical protein FMM72_04015 [Anaerotruncus colihominis]|uniref:Phage tail sheath protein n=2 Tax=Anaerotruncus colihominis TaxID=169435 RepID=A0A845SVB7_9FIRM|nr:hypothetical protein [Anaerotruncus colihominis]
MRNRIRTVCRLRKFWYIRKGWSAMINLPDSMRPGVYTSTDVRSGAASVDKRTAVAAVGPAKADYEPVGTIVEVHAYADAAVFGEESALCAMARALLAGGVSRVLAVAAGTDYETAFAALEGESGLFAVVSDGGGAALAHHINACCAMGRERVGIVAVSEVEAAAEAAGAINHTRVMVACDAGTRTAEVAAAFAAAAANAAGTNSLNGLPLRLEKPFDGTLTAVQIETLLRAGVAPFERRGEGAACVRAVTTGRTGDAVEGPHAALSTALAVDAVVSAVRGAVGTRLRGLKNNAVTRESIASQITVELEAKRALGVIDSYEPPRVTAHPCDASVCVATLSMRVAPEISQIVVAAEIVV